MSLLLVCGSVSHADDIISRAEAMRGSEPEKAATLLEKAVQASPHNDAYWREYIVLLDWRNHYFADWASRTALRLNPGDPMLLAARVELVPPPVALEVLPALARIPGHQQEAARLHEFAVLGLRPPQNWKTSSGFCADVMDRLLMAWQAQRALTLGDAYLAKPNDPADGVPRHDTTIVDRRALALAFLGRYEESLQAQAKHYQQIRVPGRCDGLADYLLLQDRPMLAVQSFGGGVPKDMRQTRILAAALYQTGDTSRARVLLTGDSLANQVLLLGLMIEAGETPQVLSQAETIVGLVVKESEAGHYGWGGGYLGGEPASLAAVYQPAVDWLRAHYPAQKSAIDAVLGIPHHLHPTFSPQSSATQNIQDFKAKLAAETDPQSLPDLRRQLSDSYAEMNRYDEAADALIPDVLTPATASEKTEGRIHYSAVEWSILKRRADAEHLFQTRPAQAASLRTLLLDIKTGDEYHRRVDRQPVLMMEGDISMLAGVGPGALSSVDDDFGPNTTADFDRLPLIAVIKAIGRPQDAPVLIYALSLLNASLENQDAAKFPDFDKLLKSTYRDQARAIEDCLTKITEQSPTPGSDHEHLLFWAEWWQANASTIISSSR